ncbi:Homeodomain-containing protein [Cynara cardunculus var. scolymus]|uniref:Homeodomain-containing protein n=1 Tax=Cynara cardunculus var. scolymus TaxID=59895 RepID=A0A118JY59_CYNCS|nr:Homeodomain-containing protein [Cynara cardunculus var. scolymus]
MFQPNMFESHHHILDMSHKTPEHELDMLRDEDYESKSGTDIMEAHSGDDQDPNQRPNKKKRYHRHTQHQIQEMESFFKECPHPDDKQRKELGRRLSLEPLQVKFWFQNKRTQMKAQHERHENTQLRNENEKLRSENIRYKEALANATCPNCGGPAAIGEMSFDEQHLRIENARLREEIDRISGIAAKYVGKPMLSYPNMSPHGPTRSLDLAVASFSPQQGMNQWSNVFSGIVSRAMTLEVLSTGVAGNYNGALQVMTAEYQVPSPLVPTRENYFVRYCKQHSDGTWAVVDVSLDNLRPSSISRCRRRPSGCLIQELPNGYSKVTWVEHVEVDDRAVHNIYRLLVNSGLAFGAKRWVATLDRQCERLASAMANNIPAGDVGVITTPEGRKSMLKLAERMVLSFCSGVGASTAHTWTTLSGSGADDVRVMTRKSMNDPGRPPGIVLSAATSFWIPVQPKRVFDFLRDENSRSEWDILSNGGLVQEMAHIANGRDQGNCVSLLRVNSANSSQSNMLILQESSSDSTGSYVIYAPVDIVAMNVVLSGGDPDYVALLPSGFAILPDGPGQHQGGIAEVGTGGSLLTVAFQILVDSTPTAKLSLGSVATVNSLIKCTVERIKAAVGSP